MAAEIWILLIVLTGAVAAAAGFAFARRGAPSQTEIDSLQQELDLARKQAANVQDNVNTHFEQSALLFGRLAHDYRAFLEHFSASARDLGIDEVAARELLERADLPLLDNRSDVIDTQLEAPSALALNEPVTADEQQTGEPQPITAQADSAQSDEAAEVEPPLIEDVVVPEAADEDALMRALESATAEAETAASSVVEVELEADSDEASVKQTKQAG